MFPCSAPPIMAGTKFLAPPLLPWDISTYGLDECLPIVLTSEIRDSATGIVYCSMLQLEAYALLDIIVKLAFANEQQHAFWDEYNAHCHLRLKGVLRGITMVLGFFNDCEGGLCTLAMLSAGVSLATELEHVLPVSDQWVLGPQLIHSICWMLFFWIVCQLYWHWSPYIVRAYSMVIFVLKTSLWVMPGLRSLTSGIQDYATTKKPRIKNLDSFVTFL